MVSLWGNKSGGDGDEDGDGTVSNNDGGSRQHSRHTREPDERSRLLPPQEGYLSPDDPAVCHHTIKVEYSI